MQDKLAPKISNLNMITLQTQDNRKKPKVLEADNNTKIITGLLVGAETPFNIILIALQSEWMDILKENTIAPITNKGLKLLRARKYIKNIKLKLLKARQYINKEKEIQDPILNKMDKYLNEPTITKKK